MDDPEQSGRSSGVTDSDNNLNDMVAKVTIETPSGSSTKYYLLYRDRCFSLGSLLVGAFGGLGVGFYSKVFFEQTRPKPAIKKFLPFQYPEVKIAMKLNGRSFNIPILFGNTVWWRVGSRAVLSSILYCALECQFQGIWYRRSYIDCGLAGAISGAIFGFRGVPGRVYGSGIGAAGFGIFALAKMFEGMSDLDSIANVIWFSPTDPLNTFVEMWYHVFLWAFFSSVFIHTIAALIAFATLRKHRVGRFFPLLVLLMGVLTPGTSGLITSAVISFVYRTSSLQMNPFYAFLYGVGQTAIVGAFSFTRILATL